MAKLKLFALSFLLAMGGSLLLIYLDRTKDISTADPRLIRVADNVFITSQLAPQNVSFLKDQGFSGIVDIRPDGEESSQAPSSEIERESKRYQLDFHYIPVPHEKIPDSAVTSLGSVLSARPKDTTLLYCRSGRRAVRTFALAEASRPGGPNAKAILEMVSSAGFTADDLRGNIDQRIAQRSSFPTQQTDDRSSQP